MASSRKVSAVAVAMVATQRSNGKPKRRTTPRTPPAPARLVAQAAGPGTNSPVAGTTNSWSLNLNIGAGGNGGASGNGGAVTVNNVGNILTLGTNSIGIFAQSVGGGGGTGGSSTSDTGGGGEGDREIGIGLGLGGKGGGGGSAGTVWVANTGTITTLGDDAHGIMAQSVGGGGGAGGANVSISEITSPKTNTSRAVTLNLGFGGDGGVGGDGGNVTVTNHGRIDTSGQKSYGILAQSVGGGGGFGGSTKVELNAPAEPAMTNTPSLAFAKLGSVALAADTNNPIGTNITSVSVTNSWNFNIAIGAGGNGGSAGNGGTVTVNNDGDIVTRGRESIGIFAQSVGGGGGVGGASTSDKGGASGDRVIGIAFGLGGRGGVGGDGGTVSVESSGTIVTLGDDAHGIMAQSVGGGGGAGGANVSVSEITSPETATMRAATLTIGLGGDGGVAGDGGTVTVTNRGQIGTSGQKSYGILAQSIGGGGGFGGTTKVELNEPEEPATTSTPSPAFALLSAGGAADATNNPPGTNSPVAHATNSWNLNLAIGAGGNGGSAGNGGKVTVVNESNIITRGRESIGIFAQSVGGGGGAGGSSISDKGGGSGDRVIGIDFSLGGKGTNGGLGDVVSVTTSGTIITLGDDAHGIMAQSVGGGGGAGGATTSVTQPIHTVTNTMWSGTLTVGLGGDGGIAGDGGTVTVSNHGLIDTSGTNAYGILAQSIGGGGGFGGLSRMEQKVESGSNSVAMARLNLLSVAAADIDTNNPSGTNNVTKGKTNSWNLNLTIGAGGKGGSAGNGGAVTVDNEGDIVTRGLASLGIFAQSVGGGGGAGGSSANENGGGDADRVIGLGVSLGGLGGLGGSGSAVLVTNHGTIVTLGDDAHGIMAQSVGGGGGMGGASVFSQNETGTTNTTAVTLNLGVGGAGGVGGNGSNVIVFNDGLIETHGKGAYGSSPKASAAAAVRPAPRRSTRAAIHFCKPSRTCRSWSADPAERVATEGMFM